MAKYLFCSLILSCLIWSGCTNSAPEAPIPPKAKTVVPAKAANPTPDVKALPPVGAEADPAPAPTAAPKPLPDVVFLAKSGTYLDGQTMTVNTATFKSEPKVGSNVTILPRNGLSAASLKIEKSDKEQMDELEKPWWNITFGNIGREDYRTAQPEPDRRPEFPFDVCIIYPEVASARLIPVDKLAPGSGPEGLLPHNIWAAIDLNEDDQVDAIFSEYFCKCPEVAPGPKACEVCDCDYTCTKSYLKQGGIWKLADSSQPM
ncbi:MAG: hypothetical protein HOI23_10910 [Deltaproteobacteria bacterium]|jgi:hypothetical protein|nr:hypothetical protein [Deltaproteobacteria bacterium]MBT6435330.1 hypothetical protein [Deltaproteobacteria bacterium]MBT6490614.1 hypothetical protein [Deltaproteobacteria bacterium]